MFDKTTWIKLPRNVVVGHGVIDELGDAVSELAVTGRPLIVTSPTPNDLIGDRIRAQFAADDPVTVTVETASFAAVERVIEAHPGKAEEYRGGRPALLGFFMGQVMQRAGGKADPEKTREMLREAIPEGAPPGGD